MNTLSEHHLTRVGPVWIPCASPINYRIVCTRAEPTNLSLVQREITLNYCVQKLNTRYAMLAKCSLFLRGHLCGDRRGICLVSCIAFWCMISGLGYFVLFYSYIYYANLSLNIDHCKRSKKLGGWVHDTKPDDVLTLLVLRRASKLTLVPVQRCPDVVTGGLHLCVFPS